MAKETPQKVFGFGGEKKKNPSLLVYPSSVSSSDRKKTYFTLLTCAPYHCAILSVSEMVRAYARQSGKFDSLCVAGEWGWVIRIIMNGDISNYQEGSRRGHHSIRLLSILTADVYQVVISKRPSCNLGLLS